MKRILSFIFIYCLIFSLAICSYLNVYATEVDLSDSSAASSQELSDDAASDIDEDDEVSEDSSDPVILDTDDVSTDAIVISSSSCCVMDADTGAILYYKNMDDIHYPASITKVLTGLLLIENADLDEVITFTSDCWSGVDYYDDMNVGMLSGEELTVEASLYAMLLASANEVCNGVALYLCDSISDFADMMNERASELGCTNTHFSNPNGIHSDDHYTTAHDMALIAAAAIQNSTFRNITGSYGYIVESTNLRPEGFEIAHKHKMLMYTKYRYKYCIGGKTGYTSVAKNTLVTYAKKNGVTLVCVTMENSTGTSYTDTTTALNYCFDNYELLTSATDDTEATQLVYSSSNWISLPFSGFNIDTFDYLTDESGHIITSTGDDCGVLETALSIDLLSSNIAPYSTVLLQLGSLNYTQDNQSVGSQTVYAGISSLNATWSNLLQTTLATTTDNLTADDSAKISINVDNSTSYASENPSASLPDRLMNFAMNHLIIMIIASVATVLILLLLIMWVVGSLKRSHHRRKYQCLRSQRLKDKE